MLTHKLLLKQKTNNSCVLSIELRNDIQVPSPPDAYYLSIYKSDIISADTLLWSGWIPGNTDNYSYEITLKTNSIFTIKIDDDIQVSKTEIEHQNIEVISNPDIRTYVIKTNSSSSAYIYLGLQSNKFVGQ